jgi:hypothetical protein
MLAGAWRATTGPRKNTDSPRQAVTEARRKRTGVPVSPPGGFL